MRRMLEDVVPGLHGDCAEGQRPGSAEATDLDFGLNGEAGRSQPIRLVLDSLTQ